MSPEQPTELWHTLVDVSGALGLSSVVDAVEYAVYGCTSGVVCNANTTKPAAKGVTRRLKQWGPGIYRTCVKDVAVSATLALGGECLALLDIGTPIEVLDVVYRPDEQRLRGLLSQGWISMLNTDDGTHWVEQEKMLKSKTNSNSDEWIEDVTRRNSQKCILVSIDPWNAFDEPPPGADIDDSFPISRETSSHAPMPRIPPPKNEVVMADLISLNS